MWYYISITKAFPPSVTHSGKKLLFCFQPPCADVSTGWKVRRSGVWLGTTNKWSIYYRLSGTCDSPPVRYVQHLLHTHDSASQQIWIFTAIRNLLVWHRHFPTFVMSHRSRQTGFMIISSVERDTIKKKILKDWCSSRQEQIEFRASVGGLGEWIDLARAQLSLLPTVACCH